MNHFKKLMTAAGASVLLIAAGCDDGASDGEDTAGYSEEMNYTITGLEPGAGQTEINEEAIETYDSLAGWEQEVSSTGAMLTELDQAYQNEEPIMITASSPHYKFANWDLKFLEDPEGVYGDGEESVALARIDLQDDHPEAYEILENITFEASELDEPLSETLYEDFEVVAENWIEDNREAVDSWIEGVDTVDGESFELVTTPWDEMRLISNITANVLEEQGYNIVLTPADHPAVLFEAVANGEADATVAPLVPVTHGDLYAEYEGQFEDLGPTLLNMEIGLAVPQYMDIDSLDELEPNE